MHWAFAFPRSTEKLTIPSTIGSEVDFSVATADTWLAMNKLLKTGKVQPKIFSLFRKAAVLKPFLLIFYYHQGQERRSIELYGGKPEAAYCRHRDQTRCEPG